MSDGENFDVLLAAAVERMVRRDLKKLESIDDAEFSPDFDTKMRRMLEKETSPKKSAHKRGREIRRGGFRRVLAACMIIFLLSTLCIAIPPVRNALVEMIGVWHDRYIAVYPATDGRLTPPSIIEEKREPAAGIDCVEKQVMLDNISMYRIMYILADDSEIIFHQMVLEDGDDTIWMNNKGCTIKETAVGPYNGYLFLYDDWEQKNLIWSDNEYSYLLSGIISAEELIRIAESVRVSE